MTTQTKCTLRIDSGSDSARSVAEIITDYAQQREPQLTWAEPDPLAVNVSNRTGRRDDFTPLQRGVPSWPADMPLIEARLFWPDAALHVIAQDGGGCLWTRITEDASANTELLQTMRTVIDVHTRSDWARFGLRAHRPNNIQAIEYRERGRLVAWRLIIAEQEYKNA